MARRRNHTQRPDTPGDSTASVDSVPSNSWGSDAILHPFETWFYIIAWTSGVLYSIYCVYRASQEFKEQLNDYFLVKGWKIIGYEKDTSNFEWDFWSGWFLDVWPWLFGHIVISFACRHVRYINFKKRDVILTIYALLSLIYILGWKPLVIFVGHVFVMYGVSLLRSRVIVWLACILLLTTLNVDVTVQTMKQLLDHDPYEKKFYLLLFTLAMANLRYTGAALDICVRNTEIATLNNIKTDPGSSGSKCASEQKSTPREEELKNGKRKTNAVDIRYDRHMGVSFPDRSQVIPYCFTLLDMLVYVFYLPLAFTGPVVPFSKFHAQFNRGWSDSSPPSFAAVWTFAKSCIRLVFWTFVIELSLHYLYFNCIQMDLTLLHRVPLWALAGVGYCHGQFFMMKYVVLFGLPSLMASLDAVDTPRGPKCIARIYRYSDMWRYFDRGLHGFLTQYIYVPLGGSKNGVVRKLCASFVCFGFVYYWHGAEDYLLVWTSLNFLGIALESLSSHVSQLEYLRRTEESLWGARCSRRVRAVVAIPLLAMSAIAIFCFFGGRQVGLVFFQRLIVEGYPVSTLLVAVFLYCCIQTSMEVARCEKGKLKAY